MNMQRSGVKVPKIDNGDLQFEDPKKVEVLKSNESKEKKGVEIGSATEPSENHPDHNEDKSTVSPDTLAVYDGMGGSERGEEGAKMAKELIEEKISKLSHQSSAEALAKSLEKIIVEANQKIYESTGKKDDGTRKGIADMGSTISLLKVWEGNDGDKKIVVANVGDSRVYRVRDGKIKQLTEDDGAPTEILNDKDLSKNLSKESKQKVKDIFNTFNDAKDLDGLSPEEKKVFDLMFKFRSGVSQGLGKETVVPRTGIYDVKPGDEYFVTSDGIHDPLSDGRIEHSLTAEPDRTPAQKAKDLIAEVKKANNEGIKRKKFDDKTVVGMRFEEEILELDPELVLDDEGEEVDDNDLEIDDSDGVAIIDEVNEIKNKQQQKKKTVPPPIPVNTSKKRAA